MLFNRRNLNNSIFEIIFEFRQELLLKGLRQPKHSKINTFVKSEFIKVMVD
jgi:hypothetical protein